MSTEHAKPDTGRTVQPAALVPEAGPPGVLAETLWSSPGGAAQRAVNSRIQQSPHLIAQRRQIQSFLSPVNAVAQMKEGVPVNDDATLEREADVMGERALQAPVASLASKGIAKPPEAVAQRAGVFTVEHYDYNPDTRHYANQVIANARFGPGLVGYVAAHLDEIVPQGTTRATTGRQNPIRNRLTAEVADYANWADTTSGDVAAMTTAMTTHLLRNPAGATIHAGPLSTGIERNLVYGLPARASDDHTAAEADRSELTENEIAAFDQLIAVCATTSRAKGTPNTVAVGNLGAVAGLDVAFAALRQDIIDQNTALRPRMDAEYDLLFTNALGGAAGLDMDVRSMHLNGAGWLPAAPVAIPVTLATLRGQINAGYHAAYTNNPGVRGPIEAMPRAGQKAARAAIRAAQVLAAVGGTTQRNKTILCWGSYAQSMGPLINYVEFNLGSRINRLMYDYVNGRFYITAHYNWYKGYNPFFQITGSTD